MLPEAPSGQRTKWYTVYRRNEANYESEVNNKTGNRYNGYVQIPGTVNEFAGAENEIAQYTTRREAVAYAKQLNAQCGVLQQMGVAFTGRYSYQVKAITRDVFGKMKTVPVIMTEEEIEVEHENDEDENDPQFLEGVKYGLGQLSQGKVYNADAKTDD